MNLIVTPKHRVEFGLSRRHDNRNRCCLLLSERSEPKVSDYSVVFSVQAENTVDETYVFGDPAWTGGI